MPFSGFLAGGLQFRGLPTAAVPSGEVTFGASLLVNFLLRADAQARSKANSTNGLSSTDTWSIAIADYQIQNNPNYPSFQSVVYSAPSHARDTRDYLNYGPAAYGFLTLLIAGLFAIVCCNTQVG